MSKKIVGSLFNVFDPQMAMPHGIHCNMLHGPVTARPIDLTYLNEKDRVDTMRLKAEKIRNRKDIDVEWCVHQVEHTNTPGTMIIDPSTGRSYRSGQQVYFWQPTYRVIDMAKIVSVEFHTHMYHETNNDPRYLNAVFNNHWIVRCLPVSGKNIKHFWVDPDDAMILTSEGDSLYTNKQTMRKAYRHLIDPTKPVRLGYSNAKMGIAC